MDGYVHLRKAI